MRNVYERHTVGTKYISKNYKKALTELEACGAIHTNPAAADRLKRKGEVTFADEVFVTFPRKMT